MTSDDQGSSFHKFDEYKLFVEDTARFSERRQKVNSTYVAVNSILLSAIALVAKDAGIEAQWQPIIVLPLLVAGVAVCLQWRQLISSYRELVGFRIGQLKKMEVLEEMASSSRMYHEEERMLYPSDDPGKIHSSEGLNFSNIEQLLPWVFVAMYSVAFIGILIIASVAQEV